MRVSNDFQIPMGIVWVNSPAARAEVPFAWKDASVRGLIDDIAKNQPGYKVELRNGVVHVFPGFIPDRENFLKLKIGTFLLHDSYLEVASFKLHTLITPIRGNYQISVAGPGDSRVSIELTDSTAENALDALVVASNRKVWIVTFPPESTLTPSGFRRTMSLFTDTPIADDEQPVWYLYRSGDPLPRVISSERP